MNDSMSPADMAAVMGNNNGFGNGDGSWIWLIFILALFGGWGNNGNFGGGFGNDYAWLSNGQKEIMQNTNNGFDTLQLANQLTGINSGVQNLSTQLCNCCADMTQTVTSGFANAETAANGRQMANMQQGFALSTQLANASADNRLGIAGIGSDIAREACATRTADTQNTQTLLTAITGGIQSIKDQICQDKIDAKNEKILELQNQLNMASLRESQTAQTAALIAKIADLERELSMADLKASQIAQNAFISQGFANEVDALYNRLNNCPVPTTPVYGRTPIFTCNNGCGCGA